MATAGNTTEPTSTQEWTGLNTSNCMVQLVTLPAGGPWNITKLGAWFAGKDSGVTARLVLMSAGGTLLRQSGAFTAAGLAFALGNNTKYEQTITAYQVNGGTQVYVGFWRDPSGAHQNGRYSSGSHLHDTQGSAPESLSGWSTDSAGGIGCYLYYESANVAPNAPTSLSPTADAIVNSGTAPTVSGTRSDPDSGDYITAYEIAVYEDDGTTLIQDTGKVAVGGSPTTFSRALALNGSHKYVKWKARTWDKGDLAGPYSALQRFYANSVPATPGAPSISSVSTLTPTIGGSFSDAGDTLADVQIEVVRTSDSVTMWASGDIVKSGTSWTQAYGGSALAWAVQYKARYRVKDSHGAYSSWSSYTTWTTVQPNGPDALTPTGTNPRQSSITPTLTVGHSAQFRNEEIQVNTAADGSGTQLWYKTWDGVDYANTTTKARTYAGTALSYGGTYYWRARVELSSDGSITGWSGWYPFRINATPNAPSGMTPTGGLVTTDTTPDLTMDFSDPDVDQGDSASLVDVEVANNSTGTVVWSQTGATPAPSGGHSHVVQPTALTNETTYKWRARFTDAMGRQGAWSGYQVFKVSQPPSAALVTPTEASTIADSTPTLDWSFSSPGGKFQYSFRVKVYDKGPTGSNYADAVLVYDSGSRIDTATAHDLPHGVVVSGHDYRWEVTVTDTDLLSYTLT